MLTSCVEIRASILDGDIDKALKLTTTYYPSVLRENENIYFKLRCHKFIEMIRSCIELHSEITGTGSRSSRRRRHRQKVAERLSHIKNQKERGRGKKGLGQIQRKYGVKHEKGFGRNGDANGEGNRGTNADEFAQDMELDNENGRAADCYNYRDSDGTEEISDAGNGSGNGHGNGSGNSISVMANWDRMDMEDGESGDDAAGHGVSIVSATNGSSQKINNKKGGESNGLAEDNTGIDNSEGEDEGEEGEEEISDSTISSNSDSDSDSADYNDQEMDDEVNDHDDSQHRNAEEATLQEKYNMMMQLTIQYGQELKSEFDGDPRREVKQALEETFALIAYPDARESMLAPLLDVSERIPVAEELNGAILGMPFFNLFV